MILKQREILNKLVDERLYEITELDEKVNTDDLMYRFEGKTADAKFDEFDNGKISLADAKNNPAEFKSSISEIKKGNKKKRSRGQKNIFYNIEIPYKASNKVIELYDDSSSMVPEAKHKAAK